MKKFLLGVLVVAAALTSQAAYLFWQVDASTAEEFGATSYGLYATQDGLGKGTEIAGTSVAGQITQTDISAYDTTYSFYIELVNSSGSVVGNSEVATYESLASTSITSDLSAIPNLGAWHGGTYSVPEPTTGLLMLMGVALVSLKRRKV